MLAALGIFSFAACGGDDNPNAESIAEGSDAHWCQRFDEFTVTLNEVMLQPSTPSDLQSQEVQNLNAMGEAFVELPVPEPIREDFDAALPRSLERPFPDEQVRARAAVLQWILENCELSDELDAELRRQVAEDREYLDGRPTTTG